MAVRHREEREAGGGGDAFGTSLVERFFAPVRRYVCMRVRSSDADDVVAEVFLRALERGKQLRSGDPGPWLFSIARSRVADYYRRRGATVQAQRSPGTPRPAAAGGETPLERLEREEFVSLLQLKMQELAETERDVIAMKFTDGLTNKEIASLVGVTPNNLGVILHRALSKLRRAMLAGLGGPGGLGALGGPGGAEGQEGRPS